MKFNKDDLISVIIPTYNRSDMISKALDSVITQSYKNLEIIVVDDYSRDNTTQILENYCKKDKRIRYLKNKSNLGAPASRNKGILNSSGNYIALLDDDDTWYPKKLELQLKKMKNSHHEVGLINCGYIKYSTVEKRELIRIIPSKKGNIYKNMLKEDLIIYPLVKRECFDKCGLFDTEFRSCQDWDLWIRHTKFYDVDYVPEILTLYNVHGEQISTNSDRLIQGLEKLISKHKIDYIKYPKSLISQLNFLSFLYFIRKDKKMSIRYILSSIRTYPIQYEAYFLLILINTKKLLIPILKIFGKLIFRLTGRDVISTLDKFNY